MKKTSTFVFRSLSIGLCATFAFTSWAASNGVATFATGGQTYTGTFSTADKLIKVDIDGRAYKGHYASHVEDSAVVTNEAPAGGWGRAFLFASSANIVKCQLNTGFPKAGGQCLDSDGRKFELKLYSENLVSTPAGSYSLK